MRTSFKQDITDQDDFKRKLLLWSQQFREVTFMDSNNYQQEYSNYDWILAVDAFTSIKTDYFNAFEDLKQYQQSSKDCLFGYLSYDLKNDTEELQSNNFDGLGFPDLFFYQPKKLFLAKGSQLEIRYLHFCDDELEDDWKEILSMGSDFETKSSKVNIQQRISAKSYLEKANKMLDYIHRGDLYEANFCMEFYAENAQIEPLEVFLKLNEISKPPFAVFFKNHKQYLLSASPERYLKKEGDTIISQPIKGTAKRFSDPKEDEKSKNELANNAKERAENIMIIRNFDRFASR